ncbi:MAG: single-stranded DNA-binding protein [Cypionkella sp.]
MTTKIRVKNTDVEIKEGISGKTGKPYKLFLQEAEAETAEYRAKLELSLPDNGKPYAVGEYLVDWNRSIVVDQYGQFRFTRQLVLTPVAAPANARTPATA